ncbi:MAG: 50S ribosomal protein L13 [Vampirovibrionia bacterium]
MKTYSAKPHEVEKVWHLIDAEGQTLGRLSVIIANLLRGKNKPSFTPHIDTGDFVIVINADKVVISGNKETDKMYWRHSGYPGGFRQTSYRDLMKKHPTQALEKAVKGMLPHNSLGKQQFLKLKAYAGNEHPHQAQNPVAYNLETGK